MSTPTAGDRAAPFDLLARLRAGASIAVDTNVLMSAGALARFNESLQKANRRLDRGENHPLRIRLFVPTLVHAERLHDLRTARATDYSPKTIADGLARMGIQFVSFGVDEADRASEHIHRAHPTTQAWRDGKRQKAIQQLGLNEEDLRRKGIEIPGKRCSATVDWFIAGQARHHDWILISADKGAEFEGLQGATLAEVEAALAQLVAEGGSPAP